MAPGRRPTLALQASYRYAGCRRTTSHPWDQPIPQVGSQHTPVVILSEVPQLIQKKVIGKAPIAAIAMREAVVEGGSGLAIDSLLYRMNE